MRRTHRDGHQWVTAAGGEAVRRFFACRELTGLYEWRRNDWLSLRSVITDDAAQ